MSSPRRLTQLAARAAVLALLVGACTSAPSPAPKRSSSHLARGGVYRVAVTSFGFSDAFDPTGEYSLGGWAAGLPMLRTLLTYRLQPGVAGTQLVPDLATQLPSPSANGLTYVFHLKRGIRFAPPVNREITSYDIAYAFERMNAKPLAAEYPFYYQGVIKGFTGQAPRPEPIAGIVTPNPQTIIFHLVRPTGDFLSRLVLPGTAPIPPEVGKCFTTPGSYGRDIVSSGPYMIQGANQVKISSCHTIRPMSGFDPSKFLTLVRNPNYDLATDRSTERRNYVDAISITIDSNTGDIFNRIQAGKLDGSWIDQPPPVILRQYLTNPSLRARLHANPDGGVAFLTMNLAIPPFDDVHVRKAVNYIIDRSALLNAWSGPIAGKIATHMVPPFVLGNRLTSSFNPYGTPGNAGSLQKAQAEMRLSKYDPKHDGKCDVAVCNHLVLLNNNTTPWTNMEPIVVADLAKIGIKVRPVELESGTAFTELQTVSKKIPISMNMQWFYDYPDPYIYLAIFSTKLLFPTGNSDWSLVGMTRQQAHRLGMPYPAGGIPSVDSQVNSCESQLGSPRMQCWANLDKYVMQNVVPVVPYLWHTLLTITGQDVTHFEADPFSTSTSFTQVAVSNHLTASP
jgi:peptide/nickel transport system substrate-binding protein